METCTSYLNADAQIATRLNNTVGDYFCVFPISPTGYDFKSIKGSLEHWYNQVLSFFDDEINVCCTVYAKPTIP